MMKKIISLFLALLLCMGLTVTVLAEPAVTYIIDETGEYLTDSELQSLNEYAAEMQSVHDAGIFYVYTTEQELKDYDVDSLVGDLDNYFVMLENDTSWYVFSGGSCSGFTPEVEDEIRAVYDAEATYVGGIEAYLEAASQNVPYIADTPEGDILDVNEHFIYDDADLLTDGEELDLGQKLMEISHTYDAQVVVATIASAEDGDVDTFLEYFYDSTGLGYGENLDGVLLLVCMDPREYRILSNGYAGTAIDSDTIDAMGEEFVSYLSSGSYAEAFEIYAEQCGYHLNGYLNGYPFDFMGKLTTCLIIGLIVGLITAFVLKGQLKTVRKQNSAHNYVRQNSMQVTQHDDYFLYRDVRQTKKESESESKSGSSRSTGGGSF